MHYFFCCLCMLATLTSLTINKYGKHCMTWDKSNKEISRILGLQFHIHLQIKRLLQKQQHLQWLLNEELWTVKYWTKSKLQQYYTVHSWTARCSQVLFLPSHIFPVIVVISSVLVYAAHCNPTLHETQTTLQQFEKMSHHQHTLGMKYLSLGPLCPESQHGQAEVTWN